MTKFYAIEMLKNVGMENNIKERQLLPFRSMMMIIAVCR